VRIRPAKRGDAELVFGLIRELAEYEKLSHAVRGNAELLASTLFEHDGAEAVLVEVDERAIGYAIFFMTFSTFECRPGLWIEDLFVQPSQRRRGVGRALLGHIAGIALTRNCARVEWSALNWNEPALRFYDQLGAVRLQQWEMLRLERDALERLATERS
jgi:GNAT superfamily N-acetyltransferase